MILKRKGKIGRFVIIVLAFTGVFSEVRAQESNILYYMQGVPQSNLLNPATQPRCGFYLGLPGVSPLQVNVENSSFGLHDIVFRSGDSTITFLHPDADLNDFLNNFGKANYISADVSSNLVSFGFRSGQQYFSFDITQKVFARFSYPGDVIRFAMEGNAEEDEFDLSSMGVNAMSYTEFAMGVSHKLNDMITFGYRGKILMGQANMAIKNSDIKLKTSFDNWTVDSKFDLNVSFPGLLIPRDNSGQFNLDDIDIDSSLQVSDYISSITGNFGLGLDLGIHIKPIDQLTVSASILDLGFIRWKNYTYNLSQDTRFVFDPEAIVRSSDSGAVWEFYGNEDFGQGLVDSLKSSFVDNNSETETKYTTYLPAKVYLGVKYQIIDQISVSMLSRSEIYKGRVREQLSLSANFYPIKMVAATLNYTIMNRTFNNFGFGLALKAGPFNMYVISDNIPLVYARDVSSNILLPYSARAVNFRMGFNLVFGCQKDKRLNKDLPLIY